jgi:acetyl-CoA carboxylase carboxyl transferase subunit beta
VSTKRRKPTIEAPVFSPEAEREFFRTPGLNSDEGKKNLPEGIWIKCSGCETTLHRLEELEPNYEVCPKCGHHHALSSERRIALLLDEGSYEPMDEGITSVNALGFKGYKEKVVDYSKRTGLNEAAVTGRGTIHGLPVTLGVMDFRFLGASMGSVVGEKLTRSIEAATAEKRGAIIVSSSGGARMHEGILSLMQMAKSSAALQRHHEAGLPFISILTHPTTGGVTASFATLGDIILAEPKCMIGFAGPRVVKETTHQDLPPGFQTAEFMLDHGLVDRIVTRAQMRDTVAGFLRYLLPAA